jgi:outer membrane protein assembly factor BamB
LACALLVGFSARAVAMEPEARQILEATGVRGGLVVHAGCGDGKLTAGLRPNTGYVVQGLETDPARVAEARKNIQALGLYGPVSVAQWDGRRLPYAENMVNLLVMKDDGRIAADEVLRVLAPRGVAYVERHGTWEKTVKPWPQEIDQWTHWLHDAGNNAVAHDTRVGPPQRMQWVVDPLWSRGHEIISSIGAVVTEHGRIMYVVDEGQPGIYTLPSKWVVLARDAFNGVLLWKHPVPDWDPPIVPGGHTHGFQPRRFAAADDRLYLTTGEDAVLTALDAATGQTIKTLDSARHTTEILCSEGILAAVTSASGKGQGGPPTLLAARPETLDVLWSKPVAGLVSRTLALAAGHLCFAVGDAVVALDAKSGNELWRAALDKSKVHAAAGKTAGTLVIHGPTVYCLAGSKLMALSLESGKTVWENDGLKGAGAGDSLFATDELLWRFPKGSQVIGHDLSTGEVRKTVDASGVFSMGHHPRCYPSKATDRYLIANNRGAEFIGLTSTEQTQNDWLRGNCGHGVMPANGLLYAPPNQCFCYGGVMLTGFKALAPGPIESPADPRQDDTRLERGPAYGVSPAGEADKRLSGSNPHSLIPNPSDWPMYRHDAARLASTPDTVAGPLGPLWKTSLGGRLTPPVAAEGMLFTADSDAHTVYAVNVQDGQRRWSYTAGGRIDSPPTLYQGLVLFGCTDGWTYCLRGRDGQLAWRFRAAPSERLVGAFGQLESAWPVHGSVLLLDGVAYLTAGRSTHLDGGIYAYGLDPKSGRVVHYRRLEGAVPDPAGHGAEEPFCPAFHVEGARSDLLVSDGKSLYMGPLKLDTQLARLPTPYLAAGPQKTSAMDLTKAPYVDTGVFQSGFEKKRGTDFASLGVLRGPMGDKQMGLHLLATGGFLDDTYYNRNYWMYASIWPGFYIAHLSAKAGELLAVDGSKTYSVQAYPARSIHSPIFEPGAKGYLLAADDNSNEPLLDDQTRGRDKGMGYSRAAPPKWFQWVPVRIRAMVAAGPSLYVAGPPDAMDASDPYAAFEGRRGAVLCAFATADGQKQAELKLEAEPVFDGLIAASGRLYLTNKAGQVVCLGARP